MGVGTSPEAPDLSPIAGTLARHGASRHLWRPKADGRRSAGPVIPSILVRGREGKRSNGDPMAVSDLFELVPAFLSHHPDQDDPEPAHVERPWNRPY